MSRLVHRSTRPSQDEIYLLGRNKYNAPLELLLTQNEGAFGHTPIELFAPGNGVTPTVNAGAGATIGSSGFVTIDGEQWFQVTATGISGSSNYFEINIPTFDKCSIELALMEYMWDGTESVGLYLGTSGYSVFGTNSMSTSAPDTGNPFHHYGHNCMTFIPSRWVKSGYTRDTYEQAWVQGKLRCTVTNGQTRTFKLRSILGNPHGVKGRLCIIFDDGYDSALNLGVPIFSRLGLPTNKAIIPSLVGNAAYCTVRQLKAYVDGGNLCVPHGPVGGTGNLWTVHTTDAERIADMETTRDYLLNNGLTSYNGGKCYVWPQGRYAASAGSVDFLALARAAGFTVGRAATAFPGNSPGGVGRYVSYRAMSEKCATRLIAPVVGHSYQGADNTAADADEDTNVDARIAAIQELAALGLDGYLMFHRVAARGAATAAAIEVEVDRLAAMASAIKTLVAANTLEVVTMDAFV